MKEIWQEVSSNTNVLKSGDRKRMLRNSTVPKISHEHHRRGPVSYLGPMRLQEQTTGDNNIGLELPEHFQFLETMFRPMY